MTAMAHIVMWKLNGATTQERQAQAQALVQAFEATRSKLSGLLRMDVGANLIEAADACDLAVCMVFESRQALAAYNAHPEHLKIKKLIGSLRLARHQVDFEIST